MIYFGLETHKILKKIVKDLRELNVLQPLYQMKK